MILNRIVLCFLGMVVLVKCHTEIPKEPSLKTVRAISVGSNEKQPPENFSGIAQSSSRMKLGFRVNGTVEKIVVHQGEKIQAGDLIAYLDDRDFRFQVDQSRAGLELALSEQIRSKANYERILQLYENNQAAKSDLDNARAAANAANAQVKAAKSGLEATEAKLSYTQLKSPITGSVVSVEVEANEGVKSGQSIAVLALDGLMEVRFSVSENLASSVEVGRRAEVSFSALPGETFPGKITEVGIEPEPRTNAFPMVLTLDQPDPRHRVGMAAEVALQGNDLSSSPLVAPPSAVLGDAGRSFVWILEKDGEKKARVRQQFVTVGMLRNDGIVIQKGLSAGDWIVTAGNSRIQDGQIVAFNWKEEY